MKLFLATDHAGFEHKESLKTYLIEQGYSVIDCGAFEKEPTDDFTDWVHQAAWNVSQNPKQDKAIIFGGSGQGEAMTANRYMGVRATVYYGSNLDIIRLSREHNDANVLSIGARFVGQKNIPAIVEAWLETPEKELAPRHKRRINEIDQDIIFDKNSEGKVVELFGWIGVIAILAAYALSNFELISLASLEYLVLNIAGSAFILIDAWKDKNWQPVGLNIVWIAVALINLSPLLF